MSLRDLNLGTLANTTSSSRRGRPGACLQRWWNCSYFVFLGEERVPQRVSNSNLLVGKWFCCLNRFPMRSFFLPLQLFISSHCIWFRHILAPRYSFLGALGSLKSGRIQCASAI